MSTNRDKKTKEKTKNSIKERALGLNAKTRDIIHSWMFLGPSVFGVSVFFILPFLVVVYYSVIKRNEQLTQATTWKNIENLMLSDRSQTQKATCHMILFI